MWCGQYYTDVGSCRFGSSCFYRHGEEGIGGTYAIRDRVTNRVIVGGNGVAEDLALRVTTIADAIFNI